MMGQTSLGNIFLGKNAIYCVSKEYDLKACGKKPPHKWLLGAHVE